MPSRSRTRTALLASLVPEGDREHSAKKVGEVDAVLLVEVGQDLRVATAPECMSSAHEAATQLLVVEQLAVLNGPDRVILVRERLMAALDVDDAEPTSGNRDARRAEASAVVGAAVHHRLGHALELSRHEQRTRRARDLYRPADAAHVNRARMISSARRTHDTKHQRPPRASRARWRSDLSRCFSRRWRTAAASSRTGRLRTAESR